MLMCCSSIRFTRTSPVFHPSRLGRLGERVVIVLRFQPPTSVRAFEFIAIPARPTRPELAQAALRFVNWGSFISWMEPTTCCSVLSGDPVSSISRAHSRGDRVHGSALNYADRVRV